MILSTASLPLPPSGGVSSMPQLGLGTWKAGPGEVGGIVTSAIKAGYRLIDCACDYGNEVEVGMGIAKGLSEAKIERKDLFITSKLWNTFHRPEHVRPALERQLADLNTPYLDLYLIHFPISLKYVPFEKRYPPEWLHDPEDPKLATLIEDPVPMTQTWAAMEQLVDEGLVRHIGLSNCSISLIREILAGARIRPSVLQVELHPYLQQQRLLDFCAAEKIAITAFSQFGGISYKPLNMDKGENLLEESAIKSIAETHSKTPAQVALRWAVQRGTAVIPKTTREERLAENAEIFDWELSAEEMSAIAQLERGRRYNDPGEFCVGMGKSIPIYD